jgi:hypothetical protein
MSTGPNPFNRIEGERQQREGQEREERRSDFNTPPNTQLSRYRLPLLIGVAGVILLVLGFIIPGWGWLAWLGLVLFLAAAFSVRVSFIGDWIPTLFARKERGNKNDIPPPPTADWRS